MANQEHWYAARQVTRLREFERLTPPYPEEASCDLDAHGRLRGDFG
jgi:hypothetical protein